MLIKGITDEDFINYKVPSMYIATATCSFKCDKEYGKPICQNSELVKQPDIDIPITDIIMRYLANPITKAIVFGGLEPFDRRYDLYQFIRMFRGKEGFHCDDDIVIYTGYTENELFCNWYINSDFEHGYGLYDFLKTYGNTIIKFGRYIPNQQPHYDPVLGIYLASDNQYAERIS